MGHYWLQKGFKALLLFHLKHKILSSLFIPIGYYRPLNCHLIHLGCHCQHAPTGKSHNLPLSHFHVILSPFMNYNATGPFHSVDHCVVAESAAHLPAQTHSSASSIHWWLTDSEAVTQKPSHWTEQHLSHITRWCVCGMWTNNVLDNHPPTNVCSFSAVALSVHRLKFDNKKYNIESGLVTNQ